MNSSHPRVYILLADQSDLAVVIRRGPSKHTATMLWDRSTDEITLGQWFIGSIYERRCDLSPDGKHFIYFALDAKWQSKSKGTYTVLSRTPYLKALGFWPLGWTYGGGGAFIDDHQFWLVDSPYPFRFWASILDLLRIKRLPPPTAITLDGYTYNETSPIQENRCGGGTFIQHHRLLKQNWLAHHDPELDPFTPYHYEKQLPHHWKLMKSPGPRDAKKPAEYDIYQLISTKTRESKTYRDWQWADWDAKRYRLVWVEHGILYGSSLHEEGLIDIQELYDFSPMKFEAIKAPY